MSLARWRSRGSSSSSTRRRRTRAPRTMRRRRCWCLDAQLRLRKPRHPRLRKPIKRSDAPGQDHANGPAAGGVGLGGIQGQGSVLMGSVRHCKQCPVQKATYTVKQVNTDEMTMKES